MFTLIDKIVKKEYNKNSYQLLRKRLISRRIREKFFWRAYIMSEKFNGRLSMSSEGTRDGQIIHENHLLKPLKQATVSIRRKSFLDSSTFQRDGVSIYLYDQFVARFGLGARRNLPDLPAGRSYVGSILKEEVDDGLIREVLPRLGYESRLEDIDRMIDEQPNGEAGFLLNDDKGNLFFVEGEEDQVFILHVGYNRMYNQNQLHHSSWVIADWPLKYMPRWSRGCQIICPGRLLG